MNITKGFRHPGNPSQGDIKKLLKLFNGDQPSELEREARRFVQRFPGHLFGRKALAASLTMQAKYAEALPVLDAAISDFPTDSELFNNRAAALIHGNRFEEAIQSAERAIDIAPNNADAYANKGLALKQLGYWHPALQAYQKAIELNPEDFLSLRNSAIALIELELYESAVQCLDASLAINPGYSDARIARAHAREQLKFNQNAREELAFIVDGHPEHDEARSKLFSALQAECAFDAAEIQATFLLDRIRTGKAHGDISAFPILSMPGATLSDQRSAAHLHAEAHYGSLLHREPLVSPLRQIPSNRPLRIGYLSGDMHYHATLMLMIGVFETHDPTKVQSFIYSHGVNDGSALRLRAERSCSNFRNIRPLSFIEAAHVISKDEIDILVDLKGYTKDNRLEICALRPAPIIVSWLGYPGSLGHEILADYLVGDPVVTPLEHQPDYSETLALMPHSYQPNDDKKLLGAAPSRKDVGLPENALVLCSFNQPYKITSDVFAQWCRILAELPDAVLWLMVARQDVRDTLSARAEALGVEKSRLIFTTQISIEQHLQRLQCADLALDTFPYGSHTTGSDALWAGVPLIAIKGDTFASRVSSSLVSSVCLPELITTSPEAAANLAIDLAQDRDRLEVIRAKVRDARSTTPLFDTRRFTQNLERLYQHMVEQHRQGIRKPIVLTD